MKVLVTAFEPFGGETMNPAMEILDDLPEQIEDKIIIKKKLPVVFAEAGAMLREEIQKQQPDAVLSLGQAKGRAFVTVERVAINCMDASIPDNKGDQPRDEKVCPDGPDGYLATVPVRAIVEAIKAVGIPSAVSNTAGTYVCNSVLYQALDEIRKENLKARAGFIHVPFDPRQAAAAEEVWPSMSGADMIRAVTEAVKAL